VQSASGDVRLGRVGGFVHVNTASGDAFVDHAGSGIHVNAVSGDVHVREAFGETRIHTVSGDQQLEAIANGPISCQSVSGDVQIGIAQGSRVFMNVGSVSGDTSSDLAITDDPPSDGGEVVNVRANTVSGDIRVGRGRALTTGAFSG